ncbi:MAG: DUF2953 domain-containing protein [Clostridia bacterium]|nr:DUF2953 domain-containing protein [Clostridia bacterium]
MILVRLAYLLFVTLLILPAIILFIIKADVVIEYIVDDEKSFAAFELRLFEKITVFKIKLPLNKLEKIIKQLDVDLKVRVSALTVHLLMIRILKLNFWLLKHAQVKKFSWKTTLGLSNPAATGIFSGFLSITMYMILRAFIEKSKGVINPPEIKVFPNFWDNCLYTHLYCILTIPMGYIITAAVKMVFLVIFCLVFKKNEGVDLHGRSSH